MFQERFGSASLVRSRVHSAPPAKTDNSNKRQIPHSADGLRRAAPSTPDPECLSRVLEARISSALAGPEIRMSRLPTKESEDQATPMKKILSKRPSLHRLPALATRPGMLVQIEDPDELSMLRSIGRTDYSMEDPSTGRLERLRIHEYEDDSEDDHPTSKTTQERRRSLVRQLEQEHSIVSKSLLPLSRSNAVVSKMEDRLSGFRHEKLRSSTRSGEADDVHLSGLVFDPDFDCYYNPQNDTYYRLNSIDPSIR